MSRPRRLRWGVPDQPVPRHPYRDTLIVYAAFAVGVVGLAWLTGGDVGKAAIVAGAFYVVACAWSLVRWRRRLRESETREEGEG